MLPATTWHYRGRCRCRSMGGGRRRRRGGRGGGGGGGGGELYYGAGRKVQCVCLQKSPVPQISGAWRLKAEGRQTQQSRGDLGQSRLASPATSALEVFCEQCQDQAQDRDTCGRALHAPSLRLHHYLHLPTLRSALLCSAALRRTGTSCSGLCSRR